MTTHLPIYLDYMATTPVDPCVVQKMLTCLDASGVFGNVSSTTHVYGKMARLLIEKAREEVANAIGAPQEAMVFVSGATEANNLAILGGARFYARKGRHVVTMTTEHSSVLAAFRQLEQEGFHVTYLSPLRNGVLDLAALQAVLTDETILVSMMHVNNETGVIQDIAAIGALLEGRGILFHVDAAQSAGKLPIDVSSLPISLMSLSAHKNYGPKGVGALYVAQKPRVRLSPLSYGGYQERGLRAGTLPTHQIVGMGEAFRIAHASQETLLNHLKMLRDRLWQGISHLAGIQWNGETANLFPGTLNVSFRGIDGAQLLPALPELAISSSSACLSALMKPSPVLEAMGLSAELSYASLRLSVGRFTTISEIDNAICYILRAHQQLYQEEKSK